MQEDKSNETGQLTSDKSIESVHKTSITQKSSGKVLSFFLHLLFLPYLFLVMFSGFGRRSIWAGWPGIIMWTFVLGNLYFIEKLVEEHKKGNSSKEMIWLMVLILNTALSLYLAFNF